MRGLKQEINELLVKENLMWRQWAKAFWLVDGDENSRDFHTRATQRHCKNKILGVKDSSSAWIAQPEGIAKTFTTYYQHLFESDNPTLGLNSMVKVVTNDMNAQLSQEFMAWEVEVALKHMAPLKAPGPDGMPPLFYQNYWNLVGNDVTKTILSYLNSATIPHPLNHTFITLIPKIINPMAVTDYRPISLCNVLYKIFSKVLANRLKKILPSIITKHQSAFTKNCLISYNILVAFETLHSMSNHNSEKFGGGVVFFGRCDEKLGFNERWIGLMMECVKTVSYSVLVNGESKGLIKPTRGIRQGDPLSPFLFLLCTEGLNNLIVKAESEGSIHGFALSRRSPKLMHLLFANDSLLFCRSNINECQKVLDLLASYESMSKQQINRGKTSIFFSKSTTLDMRNEIKEALGVPEIRQYEKYLGLPSFVGKSKRASFDYIKERVWRKLQGWE